MQKNRSLALDIMKSVLVLGMIAAHVFQLCYGGENRFVELFSLYINIITFSSFMFVFGCTSYFAYFKNHRPQTSYRLMRNFLRLLICFYISGFAYLLFISHDKNFLDYLKVLMLWKIPGYSEFLISFSILNILLFCLQREVIFLLKGNRYIVWGG